jgi:hypothetical protein
MNRGDVYTEFTVNLTKLIVIYMSHKLIVMGGNTTR